MSHERKTTAGSRRVTPEGNVRVVAGGVPHVESGVFDLAAMPHVLLRRLATRRGRVAPSTTP